MNRQLIFRAFQIITGVLFGLAVVFWFLRSGGESSDPEASSYFLPEPMEAPNFDLLSHAGTVIVDFFMN